MTYIKYKNQVGHDTGGTGVAPADWKIYRNLVSKTYLEKPSIIRMIAGGAIDSLEPMDPRVIDESYKLNDMSAAQVGIYPKKTTDNITGSPVTGPIVSIYKGAEMSDMEWNQMFAGQSRHPIIESGLTRKIEEMENEIGFRGHTATQLTGIVGGATTTTPTATTLGAQANSDGVLTNWTALIKNIKDDLSALDIHIAPLEQKGVPMDLLMTWPLYDQLANTRLDETPLLNNVDIVMKQLEGGRIYATNWLQASVTTASNTVLAIPRLPDDLKPFRIAASDFDVRPFKDSAYTTSLNVFERFSVKIINATFMRKVASLSTASA